MGSVVRQAFYATISYMSYYRRYKSQSQAKLFKRVAQSEVNKTDSALSQTPTPRRHMEQGAFNKDGIRVVKAAPGTIDPMTGLTIEEYHFSDDQVQRMYENLLLHREKK